MDSHFGAKKAAGDRGLRHLRGGNAVGEEAVQAAAGPEPLRLVGQAHVVLQEIVVKHGAGAAFPRPPGGQPGRDAGVGGDFPSIGVFQGGAEHGIGRTMQPMRWLRERKHV